MTACQNCHAEMDAAAQFCSLCGEPMTADATKALAVGGRTFAGIGLGALIAIGYVCVQTLFVYLLASWAGCFAGYGSLAITVGVLVALIAGLLNTRLHQRYGQGFVVATVVSAMVLLILPFLTCSSMAIGVAANGCGPPKTNGTPVKANGSLR